MKNLGGIQILLKLLRENHKEKLKKGNMKKYTIIVLVIILMFAAVYFQNKKIVYEEKIIDSFEIPGEKIPTCYPIELIDYREIRKNENEITIFGRTVWSKRIKGDLGGKSAVVPIEIFVKDNETGEQVLVNKGITNPNDGHIILIIKDPEANCLLRIDYKNAENCPERFKVSEEI